MGTKGGRLNVDYRTRIDARPASAEALDPEFNIRVTVRRVKVGG